MGESKKTINQISSTTKASILRKTAYGLPLRPSESGMSAEDIKRAFYAGITDKEDSIMAELERVISEANAALQNLKEAVDGQIDKKVDTVEGKGLSTNDFTNELKTKLEDPDGVPTAGSNNLITSKGVHDYPAITFAESERQKSKNLIPFPYYDGDSKATNGIIFTVNNDQSISVSGTIIDHNSNAVMWLAMNMPLKAGTYRISDSSPGNDLDVVAQIGDGYYSGEFTLSSDATARIYLQVAKDSTKTYNDTVKFMLCKGIDTDWQPYNGQISHSGDKEIEFARNEYQKSKNLCGLIQSEQTVNGVTIQLVASSQIVVLNGTATSAFDAMQTVRNMLPYVSHMQGEDLKVTAYYVGGTKSGSAIAFISTVDNNDVFGDRSAGIALPDSTLTSINFSPSKNSTYNTLMLYASSGVSFTNYMFKIQIEKGQVTDWEYPYGTVSHNKELDDVAVFNSTFSLSEANANSYQSVYDLLRVNKGVGDFYFAGNTFPSFLPPCPDDVWHGANNICQIVVKIDTNHLTKSLSMTLQGVNQNSPAYKLDAYFDGTNWRNSGWCRPSKPNSSVSDFATSPTSTTLYPSFKLIDDIHRGYCNYNSGIFGSLNALVEWVQNSAPIGFYNMIVNIDGGASGYLIMKANNSYASITQISYFKDVGLRINFLENGVWTGWKTVNLT